MTITFKPLKMNDINAKTLNGLKVSDAALAIPFLNYGLKNNDIKSLVTLLGRQKYYCPLS